MPLYPLNAQNSWTYKQKDGSTYTNSVTAANGNEFTMLNSAANKSTLVKKDGNDYITDAYEPNNFQIFLKEGLKAGDTWEIKFTANGIQSILVMTVKEAGITKEVEGKNYNDVIMIEGESKMNMNGNLMSLNFFTQFYYANNIGLILTTSSYGDYHGVISYSLN
ncbi:MAG: hypothetical protein ACHQFW_10965 [Chitinophagales bacterium]